MPNRPPQYSPCATSLPPAQRVRHRHYDTRSWRRLSAAKRAANPICEVCHEEPTEHVHHVRPLDKGGEDRWENLQSVCNSCHSTIQGAADRAADDEQRTR